MFAAPLDIIIGKNIRKRRKELGVSQIHLANEIGVSFQQIQKYEKAENRVALSTAAVICLVLDCQVDDLLYDQANFT